MSIQRFEDILAWQRSRDLVRDVYEMFKTSPARRDFVFRDQLSRASVSAMCNVAEGFGRRTHVEFIRFLDIARGSLREVQSLLYVGQDLGYLNEEQFARLYRHAHLASGLILRLTGSMKQSD